MTVLHSAMSIVIYSVLHSAMSMVIYCVLHSAMSMVIYSVLHSAMSMVIYCVLQCDIQCNTNRYHTVTHVRRTINSNSAQHIMCKFPFDCIKCVEILVTNPNVASECCIGLVSCSIQQS